jgi:hypothetical protein
MGYCWPHWLMFGPEWDGEAGLCSSSALCLTPCNALPLTQDALPCLLCAISVLLWGTARAVTKNKVRRGCRLCDGSL